MPKLSDNINSQSILTSAKTKPANFEKYQDPEGELTTGKLKFEFWYVRNKILLYRLAVIGLIIFSVINFAYSIITFGYFLLFGIDEDRRLYQELSRFPNYTLLHPHFAPQDIQVLGVQVLAGGVKKTDIIAEVINPNERFVVTVGYYFVINGVESKKQSITILPGQTNLATLLGLEDIAGGVGANLIIDGVAFRRISNHQIRDVINWQNERLNFLVSDFQFIPAGNQEGYPNAHTIKFKLNNASPFGYKEADFLVGLYQEQIMVGVIPVIINNLQSLQIRDVDLRSFAPGIVANQVKLFSNINLYDSDIYLAPPQ